MKKLRRVVAVILSLIMVLGSMTNVFAAPGKSFKSISFNIKTSDESDYEITGVWYKISNKAYEELVEKGNSGKYTTYKNLNKNNAVFTDKSVFRIQVKLSNGEYVTKTLTYKDGKLSGNTLTFSLSFEVKQEYTVAYKDGDTILKSVNVEGGTTYKIDQNVAKDGYEFSGWSDGETTYNVEDSITVAKNVTLTAVWEKLYYVEYTGAEDVKNLPTDDKAYKEGDEVILSEVTPTREGYRFKGWLLDSELVANTLTVGKSNIVLQSAWTKLYKITYVVDGDIVETKDVEAGKDVSGYAEYKYTNVPVSHNISDWTLETTDANLQAIDKDIVVSAKTSIKTFTVTYYIDGSYVESFPVNYGEDITLKVAPTYDDKNFEGWDVVSGSLTDITEDVVIVGSTSAKVYTVTYKVDGVVKATFSVEHGLAVPDYEYTPDVEYDFSGWTEKPATVTEDIVIEGTTTLKKFVVKFIDANGKEVSEEVTYGSAVELPEGPKKSDLKVENGEGAAQWIRYTFDQWTAQGNYGATDLYSVKQDMTFVATYKESPVKVYYYILNRGMAQPNEPASHDSKDYSKKGVEGALKSFTAVANNDEKVKEVIFNAPEAKDFGIELNDGEYIKWYVVKKINADKWHVDGIIVGQQYDLVVNYVDAKTGESIEESTKSSVAATENYEVKIPEIEGYKLVDETTTVAGVMPYDDVNVTVEYEKIQCTVTYKVNGEEVKTFTVEYGDKIPTYDYEVLEGYTFSGFESAELVEGVAVVKQNMVFEGTTAKKTFTITYYLNGEVFYTTSAEFEDSRELIGSPAGESQNFSGWTCVEGNLDKITENVVIVGSTTVKEFTVTYTVNGEVVDEYTVEYGSEVPASTYEVPEGYEFSGFELVTEVEDAAAVKQNMVFAGTTSLIVVEEEDIESDIPFAPGTTEEKDNNTENDETDTDDVDNNTANDVEEEELEIDTPFAPGTTESEDNSTENNETVEDDVDNSKENDVVDTDDNTVSDVEEEELEIDTPFDSGAQTGDTSDYSTYVAILLIAAVGAMVVAYNKKRALN